MSLPHYNNPVSNDLLTTIRELQYQALHTTTNQLYRGRGEVRVPQYTIDSAAI